MNRIGSLLSEKTTITTTAANRKAIGALALPLPSPSAEAESLEDGSLQLRDTLSRERLGHFLVEIGDMIEKELLEAPAWFGTTMRDGTSVRVDLGQGPDARARIARAIESMGLTILGERADPMSFSMTLGCGCGVRVDRRDDHPGDVPS